TFQTEPYYPQLLNGSLLYIPGGFDWRENYFDRKRTGWYEAMQWQPLDNLTLSQTFFRADYSRQTATLEDLNANAESFTVVPTDYTFALDWRLTDRMRLTSAVQYVQSTSHHEALDIVTQDSIPPFSVDLTSRVPIVTLAPGSTLADPTQSVWEATMDHYERHKG